MNLVPAILHLDGVAAADLKARATAAEAAAVRQSPAGYIGKLLRYSGTVLLSVPHSLDAEIARIMGRADTRMTGVLVDIGGDERLYFWMMGEAELPLGQPVTVIGYMVGVHNGTPPLGQALVLVGSVLERQ